MSNTVKSTRRVIADEKGFTIIELMVSLTIGLLLLTAAGTVFFQSFHFGNSLISEVALSREARETFDFFAMGGAQTCVNVNPVPGVCTDSVASTENHGYLFGIRGRQEGGASGFQPVESGALMARDSGGTALFRLTLPPTGNPRLGPAVATPPSLSILSPQEPTTNLTCWAQDDATGTPDLIGLPVEGCTTVGASVTVSGKLRAVPDLTTTGGSRTQGVVIDLFDPVQAADQELIHARFWNAFTMQVD